MNHNLLLKIFLIVFGLVGSINLAQAAADPNATPEPPKVPQGLNDPDYQIIKTVSNSQGTLQISILTNVEADPDIVYCAGYNFTNCFFYINDTLVDTVQFLSIDNGNGEKMFGLNSLVVDSVIIQNEELITFHTAFGDAQTWIDTKHCLNTETQQFDWLKTLKSQGDPDTGKTKHTFSENRDAFCVPELYPSWFLQAGSQPY